MIKNFGRSLQFVLSQEGGYSDNPDDDGGPTNLGITESEYNVWRKSYLKRDDPISVRDITISEAAIIYKQNYWDAMHGNFVESPLDVVLFDSCVNCGVGQTTEWLNEALGLPACDTWTMLTSGYYQQLNELGWMVTANKVWVYRWRFYGFLAAQHDHDKPFLPGWDNREQALKVFAGLTI